MGYKVMKENYLQKGYLRWLVLFALLIGAQILHAQEDIYIDPNKGAKEFRKELIMNSNKVESIVGNWGIFGKVNHPYSGVWPKGTGHGHVHEMTILVGAEVTGIDGQTYHIISDSYGDFPDRAPDGTEYFWNPKPGYANDHRIYINPNTGEIDSTSLIATSTDKTTWPESWPGKDATWNGRWNGYFGKDQFMADQECIYVMDDFTNSEFPYYPFAADSTRRGLGLQCETRMFQWVHPLAEDQIFIHFQVTNVSDYVYDRNIYFGAFADTHPGGLGASDDDSGFDKKMDMVFAWDHDNIGVWTKYRDILPGYLAWKYLESPGFGDDGIDNDDDGLIDERRDNDAGEWIFGPVGDYGEPKWHWSGDEDGDWDPQVDDVGSDGIGPQDPNYEAPDLDGTEGNGKPDQGEPNFGKTDNDESDQIGLTSFYSPHYGSVYIYQDEAIWNYIQPGVFETPAQNSNNLWIFASGPFLLERNQTERFSVCWLFGEDEREIYRNAVTSQRIYDNDYRFTKPPLQPTVKVVPGDGKITLYWDNIAERSRDPVYGYDFEGYRIYRGTNPQMTESQKISDAFGNIVYRKPIAQFDLKDGIKGLHPVAMGEELGEEYSSGIHYYLGDDTGLKYYYEDTDVQNGVTYYYAVVSYDKGYYAGMDDRNLVPISPSESPFKFTYEYGELKEKSINAVIATPNAPATNYKPGYTDADEYGNINKVNNSGSTGSIKVKVIDPDNLPDQNQFQISFSHILNELGEITTKTYTLKNLTTNEVIFDSVEIPIDPATDAPVTSWNTPIFSGMILSFENKFPDFDIIKAVSGWSGDYKTNLIPEIIKSSQGTIPMNVAIEITDTLASHPFKKDYQVYFRVYDFYTNDSIPFFFSYDKNGDYKIGEGDQISLIAPTGTGKLVKAYKITFNAPTDPNVEVIDPQPGDIFYLKSDSPFKTGDLYQFTTFKSGLMEVGKEVLNKVAVVPNPYVVAASWEQESVLSGRGERKIYFIHLPAECTIRIFTQNGVLIKTIQHYGVASDGSATWDLTTDEGLEVSFGIYIYHIEAPGIGEKVGTFGIIN
ncbi:hypothetical protein [Caldithrix abyssi]